MNLDDIGAMRMVDRSNMLSTMERTPDRLAPPRVVPLFKETLCNPENVVFGGVGGSGIIGDVFTDYMKTVGNVPAMVCRSVHLPTFVGSKTLLVGISYSGETPETLAIVDEAVKRGAKVAVVASGGKLVQYAMREGLDYLEVAEGLLPRVALPELAGAVAYLLEGAGLLGRSEKLLREASEVLRSQIAEIAAGVPVGNNRAKQAAQTLLGKFPVLLGSEDSGSVLRRFKNELNENCKLPAFYYTFPEAYHDDIEGLRELCRLTRPQPVVLLDNAETVGQTRTRERLYDLFKEIGIEKIVEFEGQGENKLQQLLTAVMFGDFVSVYLAILRGVDPSELTLIPRFRKAMRGD